MEIERSQQKDPDPPKQVTVNPSVEGVQPKNTPLGRSDPLDGLIRR